MNRLKLEEDYWNAAALDPDVDSKYICDIPVNDCLADLGGLYGEVLEIGCGVGRLMQPGYHGVDISENMLKIAKKRNPDCFFSLVEYNEFLFLPYECRTFDCIYSYLVFQHLKPDSVRQYINEASVALVHGGLFIFQFIEGTEREPFSNHYSRDEMREWCECEGMSVDFSQSKAYEGWTICRAIAE
jgi:SAM-dependent methyltransferase